jgi:hypothetical protein
VTFVEATPDYLADGRGDAGEEDWRRHWGPGHERWLEARRAFDPDGVFCSLLFPYSELRAASDEFVEDVLVNVVVDMSTG